MGLRFFKRVKILPGMTLNLTKGGASVSIGGKGGRYTFGSRGARLTAGIEGTGLYYTKKLGRQKKKSGASERPEPAAQDIRPLLEMTWWERLTLKKEEKAFVYACQAYLEGDMECAQDTLGDWPHPDIQILRGFLALRLGEFQAAYTHFRAAQARQQDLDHYFERWGLDLAFPVEVNPFISTLAQTDIRGLWLGMAEACRRQGQWTAAIYAASEAVDLVPEDAASRALLAGLWVESGQPERWDQVLKVLADIPVEEPETAAMSLMRARAMREKGEPEAGEALCKIPRRKAWPSDLYRARDIERAKCWAAQGTKAKVKKARTELQRLYAERPEDSEVIRAIASLKEGGA